MTTLPNPPAGSATTAVVAHQVPIAGAPLQPLPVAPEVMGTAAEFLAEALELAGGHVRQLLDDGNLWHRRLDGTLVRIVDQTILDAAITALASVYASIAALAGKSNVGHGHAATEITATVPGVAGGDVQALLTALKGVIDGNAAAAAGQFVALNSGIANNLTVNNLTVNGTSTVVNSTDVEIRDRLLRLNKDESGAGVTAPGQSGIEIWRGTLPAYLFVFDEASDSFMIGEAASLQPVLTREAAPTDGGLLIWDEATTRAVARRITDLPALGSPGGAQPLLTHDGATGKLARWEAGDFISFIAANLPAGPSAKARVVSVVNVARAAPPAAIDGITLAVGDVVLLSAQVDAAQNGLYVFNGPGVAMTRAPNADSAVELSALIVGVTDGVAAGSLWTITLDQDAVIDADAVSVTPLAGGAWLPYSELLQAIANVTGTAADRLIYLTGPTSVDTTAFTQFARTLLDDASASTARGTLEISNQRFIYGTGSTQGRTLGLIDFRQAQVTISGPTTLQNPNTSSIGNWRPLLLTNATPAVLTLPIPPSTDVNVRWPLYLELIQDATGGRDVSLAGPNANWTLIWAGGAAPTPLAAPAAGDRTIICLDYIGTSTTGGVILATRSWSAAADPDSVIGQQALHYQPAAMLHWTSRPLVTVTANGGLATELRYEAMPLAVGETLQIQGILPGTRLPTSSIAIEAHLRWPGALNTAPSTTPRAVRLVGRVSRLASDGQFPISSNASSAYPLVIDASAASLGSDFPVRLRSTASTQTPIAAGLTGAWPFIVTLRREAHASGVSNADDVELIGLSLLYQAATGTEP